MFLTSWLRTLLDHSAFPRNNRNHRRPCRRPSCLPLSLEHLEARTLMDASLGIATGASNPVLNSAPLFNGFLIQPVANFPNITSVNYHAYPSGGGESSLGVTSALQSQDQSSSQFRDFAVNSQGVNNPFSQLTADILFGAYGFGSGVTPNAPWMPAAYNLGLANHQFNFPSQSDLSIQSDPPQPNPFVPPMPNHQPKDGKEELPMPNIQPNDGKEALPLPPLLPLPQPEENHDPNPGERKNNHAEESEPEQTRGDPAFEEALFTAPLGDVDSSSTALATLNGVFDSNDSL